MKPQDFAKLFFVEGIGQILFTIEETDDAFAVLVVRIPDFKDHVLRMGIGLLGKDYEQQEAFALRLLDEMTPEGAVTAAQMLISTRDELLSNQDG